MRAGHSFRACFLEHSLAHNTGQCSWRQIQNLLNRPRNFMQALNRDNQLINQKQTNLV